jgi:hypothetical protein
LRDQRTCHPALLSFPSIRSLVVFHLYLTHFGIFSLVIMSETFSIEPIARVNVMCRRTTHAAGSGLLRKLGAFLQFKITSQQSTSPWSHSSKQARRPGRRSVIPMARRAAFSLGAAGSCLIGYPPTWKASLRLQNMTAADVRRSTGPSGAFSKPVTVPMRTLT